MTRSNLFHQKVLIALLISSNIIAMLPHPYGDLEEIRPFDGSGMYINAAPMEKILRENQVRVVIELGSWLGKSTRHIASILPEDGIVFAVDHWLGSVEHVGATQLPKLYEQFLSNVIHANLTHKIIPMRMTTLEAVEEFKRKIVIPDLVYVDASHDEESVYQDLLAYYPLVRGHGIICGDDWGWGYQWGFPVSKAVSRFAMENHLIIDVFEGWFWVLRKNKGEN